MTVTPTALLWLAIGIAQCLVVFCEENTVKEARIILTVDQVPERLQNGLYAKFAATEGATGPVLYSSNGCAATSASQGKIAVVPRGNCTFLTMANAYKAAGARAILIVDYQQSEELVLMGPEEETGFIALSISFAAGEAISQASNATMEIFPIAENEEPPSPLYTRTAVFAVLCVLIIFILSIYCQGSLRHMLLASNGPPLRYMSQEQNFEAEVQEVLKKMPISTFKEKEGEENVVCAVCLEEFEDECEYRHLPCAHDFHSKCIDPWLLAHRTCPLCKLDILDKDDERNRSAGYIPAPDAPEVTETVIDIDGIDTTLMNGTPDDRSDTQEVNNTSREYLETNDGSIEISPTGGGGDDDDVPAQTGNLDVAEQVDDTSVAGFPQGFTEVDLS